MTALPAYHNVVGSERKEDRETSALSHNIGGSARSLPEFAASFIVSMMLRKAYNGRSLSAFCGSKAPLVTQRSFVSSPKSSQQQPPTDPGPDTSNTAKPRKPLSRVAIGGKPQRVRKGNNQMPIRTIWASLSVMIVGGGGIAYIFNKEKQRLEVRRQERERQGIGKPSIGGPFELTDFNGNKFTDKDLLGKFSISYFGFTMCPDVCPEESEILAQVSRETNKDPNNKKSQPIFITCDPARDTPEVSKEYLADFHPDIIGLTGTYDQIKDICHKYRVYFSTPPNVKPGQSYLVDHSIFFYLMDPEGKFIDVLGRNYNGPEALAKVNEHLDAWRPSGQEDSSFFGKFFK